MSTHVVLVVDANTEVVDDLATRLTATDQSVVVRSAATATAAEEAVADGSVDCIVSEHGLEDGDGVELLCRLGGGYPDLTRVLFTDAGSEAVASDAIDAGVDAYVPKQLGGAGAVDSPATMAAYDRVASAVEAGLDAAGRPTVTPEETAAKIDTLHDVAMDLESCTVEADIYQVAVDAADMVLEFDMSNIDIVEDGRLKPVQTSAEMPKEGVESVPLDGESVAARVARTGEAMYTEDLRQVLDADPTQMTYRSGLTVPISDIGVFQAISEEVAAFDQADVDLAETLMQHVAESVKRIRFQRTLREERDRFAALFENVPDPVVRLRTAGTPTIAAVNEAFAGTFDFDAGSVVGRPLETVLTAPETAGGVSVFPGIEAADNTAPTELRLVAADGPRDFLVHVVPVDLTASESDEVYGFYADITPTKERKRELARQNERLDEFASIVSHDLRNPLNIAEGHLQLATDRIGPDEDLDDLDEVERAHGRMRDLIENLLSLARSGSVVQEPDELSLTATAGQAWSSVHLPNARLETTGDVRLRADRDRLVDLFVNLFRNAVDHGRPDATVRVGPLDDRAGFYVADDGPGIPEAARDEVFDSGYTTTDEGTGFGLAIVHQVATAHDWTATVTESEHGGARFEFPTADGSEPLATEHAMSVEPSDED
ncbi:ATP-binding protein [Haloarchaeobius iranensis]|uniref:histidine kinase n=1 Tax=Haloarchaeobius iranensis TaxID=996166 RepID=A0A1G9TY10_9EURY|nr:ATP-binding protein [Haloarchaeobius iranensis]SDM52518.1 PAS domain S-box-containing protein [Haloarchaeobius iranensis]